MGAHSKVGASAAKRWLSCPGSVRLIDELGQGNHLIPDDPSEEAEDGTFAHRVLELILVNQEHIADTIEAVEEETKREAPAWCEGTVEAACDVLLPYLAGHFWAEQKVTFAPAYDGFGTLDFAAWKPGRLTIADLKTGVGVRVVAQDNPQLMCYAVGALRMLGPDRPVNVIEMIVIQPRVPGGITRWEITTKALKDWERDVLVPGLTATAFKSPLKTGEHCRFCPAMAFCPQLNTAAHVVAKSVNSDQVPHDDTAWVLENAPIIRKYLAEVEKLALRKALAGNPPLGYKVVPGKANRTWKDGVTETLELLYGEGAFDRRVKSPAQIEGLPGGKDLALAHAYSPQGAPTLVKEDDPRPAWSNPKFADMFSKELING